MPAVAKFFRTLVHKIWTQEIVTLESVRRDGGIVGVGSALHSCVIAGGQGVQGVFPQRGLQHRGDLLENQPG